MSADQAIVDLLGNTEHFLRTNCLMISGGSSAAEAGAATFWMTVRSSGGFGASKLNLEAAKGKTNLFPAWYVPMQQLGAVGAPTFAVNWLPTGAESDIRLMVTSQLTACLFGMARTGGKLGVAHIQPDATAYTQVPETQRHALRQSDLRMAARVKGLTTLAAQGGTKSAFSVVGDDAYDRTNHECVTIVGVRGDNDQWAIYKQKWSTKTNTVLDVTTR